MHPERVIVLTYRRLDNISKRQDDQNTLTRQSADTNNAPRDLLLVPITWKPAQTRPYIYVYIYIYIYVYVYFYVCVYVCI